MKSDDFYIGSYVFQRDKNIAQIEKSKKSKTRGISAEKVANSNDFRHFFDFHCTRSPTNVNLARPRLGVSEVVHDIANDGHEGGWKVPEAFSNLKEQK